MEEILNVLSNPGAFSTCGDVTATFGSWWHVLLNVCLFVTVGIIYIQLCKAVEEDFEVVWDDFGEVAAVLVVWILMLALAIILGALALAYAISYILFGIGIFLATIKLFTVIRKAISGYKKKPKVKKMSKRDKYKKRVLNSDY